MPRPDALKTVPGFERSKRSNQALLSLSLRSLRCIVGILSQRCMHSTFEKYAAHQGELLGRDTKSGDLLCVPLGWKQTRFRFRCSFLYESNMRRTCRSQFPGVRLQNGPFNFSRQKMLVSSSCAVLPSKSLEQR